MPKSIPVAMLLCFSLLSGCGKATDKPAEPTAPTTPTAPTVPSVPAKPDAPGAVVSDGQNNTAGAIANAGAAVSASVSANGVEARAGDVSVKLPD